MDEKISVIISCYKSNQDFLKQAIDSILSQTYSNFELLIRDDGVDFNLKDYLNNFNDNRIKFIDDKIHLGNSRSMNKLIDLCNTNFIAFHDHDDISLPNRLEVELKEFQKDSSLTSVSSRIHIFGTVQQRDDGEEMTPDKVSEELLFFQPIKHCSVMINKNHFIDNNIKFDENFTQACDYELWSRIRNYKHKILKDILVNYRKHLTGETSNIETLRINHAKIIQRNMKQIGLEFPLELCEMLDPFNNKVQDKKYLDIFINSKNTLLLHISESLFNRKKNEIMNKIK